MLHIPLALRMSQSDLKAAIHKHQILLSKLKESPSDEELQKQLDLIEKHILNLGLLQNKIVKKLRKDLKKKDLERKDFEKKNTKSPEKRKQLKPSASDHKQGRLNSNKSSKSTEKIVQSGTLSLSSVSEQTVSDPESGGPADALIVRPPAITPCTPAKSSTSATNPPNVAKRNPSLSPPSYCAITDRVTKNRLIQSQRKTPKGSSSPSGSEASHDSASEIKPFDAALNSKLEFMTALGLVTRKILCELQNRRFERKRRSTANPQFVYGNCVEHSVKRKKTASNGILNGDNGALVTIDRLVPVPNSTCLVCSSAKGVLSVCWSCRRAFHWNCVTSAPIPPSSEGQLHCPSCRKSAFSTPAETVCSQ